MLGSQRPDLLNIHWAFIKWFTLKVLFLLPNRFAASSTPAVSIVKVPFTIIYESL